MVAVWFVLSVVQSLILANLLIAVIGWLFEATVEAGV